MRPNPQPAFFSFFFPGVRIRVGEHMQKPGPVGVALAHADDAAASRRVNRPAHPAVGFSSALIVCAWWLIPAVELGAGVEVVVIGGGPAQQPFGPAWSVSMPAGDAGLQDPGPDTRPPCEWRRREGTIREMSRQARPCKSDWALRPCAARAAQHRLHRRLRATAEHRRCVHRIGGSRRSLLRSRPGLDAQREASWTR